MFRIMMKYIKFPMQPDFIIPTKKTKTDQITLKNIKSMEIPKILTERYPKKKNLLKKENLLLIKE